jgi:hypothetical protein
MTDVPRRPELVRLADKADHGDVIEHFPRLIVLTCGSQVMRDVSTGHS